MPQIDPNAANRTRKDVRTSHHQKAQTVRKAKVEVAKPVRRVAAPAPRVDLPSTSSVASANNERRHVEKQVRVLKKKGGSLRKKTAAVHELARVGALPKAYLTGIEGARREQAAKVYKLDRERQARIKAVEDTARAHGYGETLGPPVPHKAYQTSQRVGISGGYDLNTEKIPLPTTALEKLAYKHTTGQRGRYTPPKPVQAAVAGIPKGLMNSAAALIEGTARDPIGVPTKTTKQGALAVAASPAAIAGLVAHPLDTAKATVKDYSDRNSESYDDKLARVRKEGGLPEASDIVTALSLGGGAAAKTALLRKAPARAAKVLSGGARATPKKGGPVRYGIGSAVDRRKAAKYERIAARAERGKGPGLSALQHEALQANRAAGHVVAVVPRKSGRKIAGVVAKARGKSHQGLKYDSAKGPFEQLAQERFRLNKHEAKALWLGTEVGVRDADTARKIGTILRDKMAKDRGDYTPTGWERDMDVIAQIDEILKAPEKYFTPKFAATMDRIHEHAQQISAEEPQFKAGTKENRRRAVQAYALGLERGVGGEAPAKPRIDAHAEAAYQRDLAAYNEKLAASPEARKLQERITGYENADTNVGHALEQADALRGELKKLVGERPRQPMPEPAVPALKYADETDAEFNARIDDAAKKAGLSAPTYFRSEKQQGLSTDFGARTVGGGGPKSTGKTYLGKNLGQGIFDTTYDQFLRGYAHNIKATHNYPLIAKLDDDNRLRSFSPDDQPQGEELGSLMNKVNRQEPLVDKGSVVFVNKGLFRKALEETPDSNEHADVAESLDADAKSALEGAIVRDADTANPDLLKTTGWVAWPKEALRELEAELNHGTAGGRVLDIAKGSASKAILLTANVPWLALQAASETAVTGIATKGRALTPRNVVGTARWWKAMNHRQRTHVATELGLGATGNDTASIKLGATTNNHMVNAWRDMKAADFWHRPRVGNALPVSTVINPVKWMRAADQGKTNVTRLLAGHAELTKKISPESQDSLAGAMTNMATFGKNADRLLPVFKKPSAEQLDFLQRNPKLLEDMGDSVANALGDWTTMTAKERMWANRAIMFYPFVRYSTRMLLHTLPVDHPAVTAVLAELGHLKAEEYRAIFGDDDLPWNMGKVYFGKTGESEYIDLSRANPVVNSGVAALARLGTKSSNAPGAALGSLPPYAQWLIDDATGVNTFKGRPQKLEGDTAPFWNPAWKRGPDVLGKLLIAQVQSLFYPAREAMSRLHPGAQSDESSLLFPVPMGYKSSREIKGNSEDAKIRRRVAQNAERNEAFQKGNDGGVADYLLGPLLPKKSRDKAASEERRYVDKLKAAQDKKAAERKKYRDSHGGKNKPKPSGFGGGRGNTFGGGGGKTF